MFGPLSLPSRILSPKNMDLASVTILPEDVVLSKKCFAEHSLDGKIWWNFWQFQLLKKIYDGVYNAEIVWTYDLKYGKIGKKFLYRNIVKYYEAEEYTKEIRFTGQLLNDFLRLKRQIRAIIIIVPYVVDVDTRTHIRDALEDIETFSKKVSEEGRLHPVIIVLSPRHAQNILGVDPNTTFKFLATRELGLPTLKESFPAEELIDLFTSPHKSDDD